MAYFKEANLHQDGPDIKSVGDPDWQRCQHKALHWLEPPQVLSPNLGDMRAPGPGAKACSVRWVVACPLRTVLGVVNALKL